MCVVLAINVFFRVMVSLFLFLGVLSWLEALRRRSVIAFYSCSLKKLANVVFNNLRLPVAAHALRDHSISWSVYKTMERVI